MYTFSILISKIAYRVIRLLKIGSGYTWPGNIILDLFPNILEKAKLHLPDEVIVVSGTNGKTTTVKLIRHILEKEGLRVLSNDSGANLINGVVSVILLNSKLNGSLPYDVAVFELDELNLPDFVKTVKPGVLIILNLSRDQLDRYWEKEVILERWKEAVVDLDDSSSLILDASQKQLTGLSDIHKGKTLFFDDSKESLKGTKLTGSFNAKNVNCALLVAEILGVDKQKAQHGLSDFKYAYGRGEVFDHKGKRFQILLAKNPESLNQNLRFMIEENPNYQALLFILNDNIPDGRDVSWIYDVNPDMIAEVCRGHRVFVSGTRDLDMAIRLGYAGATRESLPEENIDPSIKAVAFRITSKDDIKKVIVLPNYSAMLEFRKVVLGKKIL